MEHQELRLLLIDIRSVLSDEVLHFIPLQPEPLWLDRLFDGRFRYALVRLYL